MTKENTSKKKTEELETRIVKNLPKNVEKTKEQVK